MSSERKTYIISISDGPDYIERNLTTEEELISEEELDELAWNSAKEEYIDDYRNPYSKGYKAGFKKAIETLIITKRNEINRTYKSRKRTSN